MIDANRILRYWRSLSSLSLFIHSFSSSHLRSNGLFLSVSDLLWIPLRFPEDPWGSSRVPNDPQGHLEYLCLIYSFLPSELVSPIRSWFHHLEESIHNSVHLSYFLNWENQEITSTVTNGCGTIPLVPIGVLWLFTKCTLFEAMWYWIGGRGKKGIRSFSCCCCSFETVLSSEITVISSIYRILDHSANQYWTIASFLVWSS